MPEDFFAQGFSQEQGPIFTKQQNEFLEKKIVFLDPMKTYQISIGKVLALLKYTNLDNETIKKILNNSCANGIGQKIVTYEEMKKIFRGVALKQNKIQPSKINIEANIKTKMPIFYDDDESEQQQQPKPQSTQQKPSEPIKTPSQTHVAPVNQPPQPPKPQQQPSQMNPLKAFDEYWKTLKTKNNLIDGAEVKKMFSNNSVNKNNLSKAWKLCNISEKGVLTKGQFFIFMNLIHGGNIPETLTKQMKDFIRQIEEACGYKKAQTQPTSQRASSTSNPAPKSKGGSDAFDKFGDESLFVKNSSKVEELSKSVTIQKSLANVFSAHGPSTLASSSILSPPPTTSNIPQPSSKAALQLLERVQTRASIISKQQKTHHQQLSTISTNNQHLITGLSSIQQYLQIVQQNFLTTTKNIQTLKQSQNSLNQRLNNVCVKFKNIITKQSECIAFLMESMKVESEASQQRIDVLESYTEEMLAIVEGNMNGMRQEIGNLHKHHVQAHEAVREKNQQLREKLSGQKVHRSPSQHHKPIQNPSLKGSPQIHHYTKTDPFDDNQAQQHHQQSQQPGPSSKSLYPTIQQPPTHFPPQSHPQSGHIFLQNLSPEQRKKTKQMLLIQILNSVSSMTQQEYKQVVNKVVAMTEEQMNQSYTKLYALYMQNIAKTGVAPKYPVPTPEEFTVTHS